MTYILQLSFYKDGHFVELVQPIINDQSDAVFIFYDLNMKYNYLS